MSNRVIEIKLPKLGESIVGATIVQWLKEEGDSVSKDEPILEVSTDKINSEIPAPQDGVITEILAQKDQEVEVGAPLAKLLTQKNEEKKVVAAPSKKTLSNESSSEKADFYSPAVLRLAHQNNLSMDSLSQIKGSGDGGRVTKQDVENYLSQDKAPTKNADKQCPYAQDVEKMPITGLRKAIADNMVKSFYEAPHASLIAEVDVTEVMDHIKQNKEAFYKKHGVKLTITSFIVKAIADATTHFPMTNATVDKDTILLKRFVNVGLAVSIDHGVIVPVIRNCQSKSIEQIAAGVAKLSDKARTSSLSQDDVSNGTITMTNFGMTGMHIGVPIIRYPEVAIVGVGSIHPKVMPLSENSFGVRKMVYLTLTFDHRIIDGIYGANFLNHIKQKLSTFSSFLP